MEKHNRYHKKHRVKSDHFWRRNCFFLCGIVSISACHHKTWPNFVLFISLSLALSVHLSVCLSVCLSGSLSLSLYLSLLQHNFMSSAVPNIHASRLMRPALRRGGAKQSLVWGYQPKTEFLSKNDIFLPSEINVTFLFMNRFLPFFNSFLYFWAKYRLVWYQFQWNRIT